LTHLMSCRFMSTYGILFILASIAIFFIWKWQPRSTTNGCPTQEGMPDMAKMMKIMIYVSPLMMLFF
jgi:YidC/Oxa1 family membrane protein insertase